MPRSAIRNKITEKSRTNLSFNHPSDGTQHKLISNWYELVKEGWKQWIAWWNGYRDDAKIGPSNVVIWQLSVTNIDAYVPNNSKAIHSIASHLLVEHLPHWKNKLNQKSSTSLSPRKSGHLVISNVMYHGKRVIHIFHPKRQSTTMMSS